MSAPDATPTRRKLTHEEQRAYLTARAEAAENGSRVAAEVIEDAALSAYHEGRASAYRDALAFLNGGWRDEG